MKAGDVVDGWRVVRFLGGGRSGSVFEVRSTTAGRQRAALKAWGGAAARASVEEFRRETDFVEQHRLPGVLPDFISRGKTDGIPFFVMEYAETLPKRLLRRKAKRVFSQIAEALAILHATGHLHCDVKPTNIGLIDGRAVETQGYANPEAYGMLADCYRRGRGTKKDPEKSRRYATLAAERGDERGKKVLKRLK